MQSYRKHEEETLIRDDKKINQGENVNTSKNDTTTEEGRTKNPKSQRNIISIRTKRE